jgi:hypothetical protein
MNLADYLSELLGQHDEVSVPGLGYFVRTRINAYFNDSEARFYPPYHQVKFVPQPKDDDIFAQYVADKKNISLASSKYFVEKFISKLKEEAARGKFLFADLGSFQTEHDQLVFKPNDRIPADPAFYGYPPVNIYRLGQPAPAEQRKPVSTPAQPIKNASAAPVVESPPPVQKIRPPQYYEDDIEPKKGLNIWLVVLIAVAVAILGILAIFKFSPSVYDRFKDEYNKITGKTEEVVPVIHKEIKTDTLKKTLPVKDTTVKPVNTVVTPVDTVKQPYFEIIIGNYSNPILADAGVKYFKNRGVNARILNLAEAPGPRIKVSAGSYPTNDEAQSMMIKLIQEHKILPSSYTIKITPLK